MFTVTSDKTLRKVPHLQGGRGGARVQHVAVVVDGELDQRGGRRQEAQQCAALQEAGQERRQPLRVADLRSAMLCHGR